MAHVPLTARPLSYVALRSHDGRRVVLPVAAAAGSRVLHGILQGLQVMRLHQSASSADSSSACAPEWVDESAPPLSSEAAGLAPASATAAAADADADHANSGAAYHSYATVFPSDVVCVPSPSQQQQQQQQQRGAPPPPPLIEVPVRSLESSTLTRVAEFLVVKVTLANHPHYLHEADVLGDLDRTSERDQLVAMQVLLGADFLNC